MCLLHFLKDQIQNIRPVIDLFDGWIKVFDPISLLADHRILKLLKLKMELSPFEIAGYEGSKEYLTTHLTSRVHSS